MRKERPVARAVFWAAVYLALVSAPLAVLLAGTAPASRGFWRELSAALGYAGMAMVGIQFALTARFWRATAPFGVDVISYFHRHISLVAAGIIAAHVAILFTIDPKTRALLCGPDPMRLAVERALYRLQVPLGRVHAERFNLV